MMETMRLLDLGTGTDKAFPRTGAQFGEGGGVFSPDGSLVAFRGFEASGTDCTSCPPTGARSHGPSPGSRRVRSYAEFAPDGTKVMLNRFGNERRC